MKESVIIPLKSTSTGILKVSDVLQNSGILGCQNAYVFFKFVVLITQIFQGKWLLYHGILLSARFCSRFKLVITQRVPMFDAKGYSSPCHFPALTTHNGAERICWLVIWLVIWLLIGFLMEKGLGKSWCAFIDGHRFENMFLFPKMQLFVEECAERTRNGKDKVEDVWYDCILPVKEITPSTDLKKKKNSNLIVCMPRLEYTLND